jgi:hypothetical protein
MELKDSLPRPQEPFMCPYKVRVNPLPVILYGYDTGRSRDSSVGIATGYGLDDRGGGGVLVPVGSKIFTSPCRPDRLWGPPNLL